MIRAVIALRNRLTELNAQHALDTEAAMVRVIEGRHDALRVLAASTTGFIAAGLVLALLLGYASMEHHGQWRKADDALGILQETIEAVPVGVTVYDKDDRLLISNSAAAALTAAHRRSGGRDGSRPELRLTTDGRWHEWFERPMPSGRTVGLQVDVTDLKRSQIAAQVAHGEYRVLLESLSDVVFKIDVRRGLVIFASAAAADLFGVPPEELLGSRVLDHVLEDDRALVLAATRAEMRASDGGIRDLNFRIRTPSGEVHHAQARFRRLDDDSADVWITGVLRDQEEQVRLAEGLEAERARLRSIVESSGAMVLVVDRDLKVAMANLELAELYGFDTETAVGRPMSEVVDWQIDLPMLADWLATERLDPGLEAARLSARLVDSNGRERIVSITAKPVASVSGAVQRIVFLAVDDTARREAEQALFDSERLATVGEMAAAVAHEVNQPLQVIHTACESARDELADPAGGNATPDAKYIADKLDRIDLQVERASRIVRELRAFVRGTSSEPAQPFDPGVALNGAVDLTSHTLRQAQVALSLRAAPELPMVLGHVGRLEQVLVNLINNARDAGSAEIVVIAEPFRGDDGRLRLRIAVRDRGPGIAPHILPQLFEAFVTTEPRGKGTGLGLRICHRIVEEMGGAIAAANRPEGGAQFEIVLPAAA